MSDDYLWDGSGRPDPEIARLETVLLPLRHREAPLVARPAAGRARVLLAAAAAVAAVAAATGALRDGAPGWDVTAIAGTPRLGAMPLAGSGRWRVGEWLVTDEAARAAADVGDVGRVIVGPLSRLRLVDARPDRQRMALAEGRIHATIFAPPLRFFVDTPAATAVDLGCEYTLETDAAGNGLLRVRSGWVGFEWQGLETFVPAGARCLTRAGRGPGTPFFETARPAFQDALVRLDFEARGGERTSALGLVLAQARPRDAMSLWHLLRRLPPPERPTVFERLAVLVPPPEAVGREAAVRGDPAALDLWWDALDLDDVTWWRKWKGGWPRAPAPRPPANPQRP